MSTAQPNLLRRLGLGRLLYHTLHRPAKTWAEVRRLGPARYLAHATGDARMRRAAARFAPLALPDAPAHWPSCRFLTGQGHWQQTVFCARSLELALSHRLRFEFFDDGTFDPALAAKMETLFPGSRVYRVAESDARVEAMLPPGRYPALHSVRRHCKYHRKLFDLRAYGGGWNLYLDSDMLFHSPPEELRAWMEKPDRSLFLHDAIEGLFTSAEEFGRLAEGPFVRNLNAGLLAIDDRTIDWDHLEWFSARCSEAQHGNRTFEQNLAALHMSRVPSARLDPERYRVIYDEFVTAPPAVLIHYCWHSNPCYRAGEWRRIPRHTSSP